MTTFGNIAAILVGGVQKPAGGYWRRSRKALDSLSALVIERRWKRTHMVRNRIPVCHVAIYLRYVACLTYNI